MNRVLLSGRLTKDPDVNIRNGANGKLTVANFVLAVPRNSNPRECNFIQCVSFGNTAENVKRYLRQGIKIIVDDGEWRTDEYTDRNGHKVYLNQCWVKHFEFAESKSRQQPVEEQGFMTVSDEELARMPFT